MMIFQTLAGSVTQCPFNLVWLHKLAAAVPARRTNAAMAMPMGHTLALTHAHRQRSQSDVMDTFLQMAVQNFARQGSVHDEHDLPGFKLFSRKRPRESDEIPTACCRKHPQHLLTDTSESLITPPETVAEEKPSEESEDGQADTNPRQASVEEMTDQIVKFMSAPKKRPSAHVGVQKKKQV